tara:strand:- start:41 stop:1390 length:1350 start_codon:yes stop_codon:yes gene_type:complete
MKNSNKNKLEIEKSLPHNFLAEKIVLAHLLINEDALEIIIRALKVKAFYFKNHQQIYESILKLHKNEKPVNITTLTTFLQDNGRFKSVGGVEVLSELFTQVADLTHLEEYIALIQDKFIRRILIKLGYQIINSAYITNISLENILIDLELELFNLTNTNKQNSILTSAELLTKVILELKERSNDSTIPGFASGFFELDALTQGFQKSDLIIIAGRPSMGKTAFCLNAATNIIKKHKLPILFFSLEMSKEQLIYRLLANETNISNTRLKVGNIQNFEWKILNKIIKKLATLPFFIDDLPNLLITEIRSKIKKIIFEHNKIGLVVIDYLQLMETGSLKNENRVQELSQITRALKNIAREFDIPIIVLSQLSRNVESRINKRPILSDLRESGSIEQDSDLVIMLYRDDYYNKKTEEPNIAELILAKHRNGPIGSIKLNFSPKFTKFTNISNA